MRSPGSRASLRAGAAASAGRLGPRCRALVGLLATGLCLVFVVQRGSLRETIMPKLSIKQLGAGEEGAQQPVGPPRRNVLGDAGSEGLHTAAAANSATTTAAAADAPTAPAPAPPSRPPSNPYDLPLELYQAVQLDPSLLLHRAIADAFLPTPWLLPAAALQPPLLEELSRNSPQAAGTIGEGAEAGAEGIAGGASAGAAASPAPLLGYWGLHNDLEALLRVRSAAVGDRAARAVSVVYFSASHAAMLQNWVYTAVKWAGITNYVVATWEERSLADCLAMRMPCFNASRYLPLPLEGTSGAEAQWRTKNFIPLTWVKPLVARDVVRLGYHVHSSDVDISFPPKPFWPSLLAYLEGPGADIAMERDYWGPINTGCVVVRPTPYGLAWLEKWTANAQADAEKGVDDQERVMTLGDGAFRTCEAPWDCDLLRTRREGEVAAAAAAGEPQPDYALIRRYYPAWDAIYQDHCAAAHPEWVAPIDPCLPSHTNYHAVCTTGADNKIRGFQAAGLWFLDHDMESSGGCMRPPAGQEVVGVDTANVAAFAAEFVQRAGAAVAGSVEPAVAAAVRRKGQVGAAAAAAARRRLTQEAAAASDSTMAAAVVKAGEGAPQGMAQQAQQAAVVAPVDVARCRPLAWRLPAHESAFQSCNRTQLAYVAYPHSQL